MKWFFALGLILSGCTYNQKPLGTSVSPIKINIMPTIDSTVLQENAKKLQNYLESNTQYKFKIDISDSYTSAIEAFKKGSVDIATLNTRGYYIVHNKFGGQARLTVIRNGRSTYQSQFVVREDSKINSIKDLKGKRIAFVDPDSMSGYILPLKILNEKKTSPKAQVFVSNHEAVIKMVYQGKVDAGATYYNPPQDGLIEDARKLVQDDLPDVEKKVRILFLSEPIPNDPIVFRKDIPEEIKEKIIDTLIRFVSTEEGRAVMSEMLGATHLKKSRDEDYVSVRDFFQKVEI